MPCNLVKPLSCLLPTWVKSLFYTNKHIATSLLLVKHITLLTTAGLRVVPALTHSTFYSRRLLSYCKMQQSQVSPPFLPWAPLQKRQTGHTTISREPSLLQTRHNQPLYIGEACQPHKPCHSLPPAPFALARVFLTPVSLGWHTGLQAGFNLTGPSRGTASVNPLATLPPTGARKLSASQAVGEHTSLPPALSLIRHGPQALLCRTAPMQCATLWWADPG